MSKSYNNTIPIFGSEKIIRKKIMSIITDTADIDEPKAKDTPLFKLYCLFASLKERESLSEKYDGKGLRYGDVKIELFDKVMDYFSIFRDKRKMLFSKPDDVFDILSIGAKKAKLVASEILERVRIASGLNYRL